MDIRKIMFVIVLALNGIILINACKKEKTEEEPEFDTQTSEDNALAENTFNDISIISFQAMESDSLSSYRIANPQNSLLINCATITRIPNGSGGGTMVVNFGATNCSCRDGRIRRGIINIAYTGNYFSSGTVITISFDNYYVGRDVTNMFKVTGTKTIANNGLNSLGNPNFSIQVNGHLMNSSGAQMEWTSTRNREWINGSGTPLNWVDDEYVITGNGNGTNFSGSTFTASITKGIHIENCDYITQGKFELIPYGKPARVFDFGNGACDDKATLTVNGKTFQITLR